MRLRCTAIVALLLLTACNAKPIRPDRDSASETKAADALSAITAPGLDIGTVEDAILIEANVREEDRSSAFTIEEERTYKKDLTRVVVESSDPTLSELWLTFTITSKTAFTERPVAVRLGIWREIGVGREAIENREKIGEYSLVFGENANQRHNPDGTKIPPQSTRINALAGLTEIPETMMIHGEAELLHLPKGTPENLVNPETATVDPQNATLKGGNPVRINFSATDAPS